MIYICYTAHMLQPWTFLIASHAIAASLAMLIGGFQIFRPKGGDAVHKALGRIWVGLMIYVSIGSFFFGGYGDAIDLFLRGLAIWTLFSVVFAIYQARRGNIATHRGLMVGTHLGLIGAFIGVVAVHTRRVPSWFMAHPLEMTIVALIIIAVAGFIIAAILQRYSKLPPSDN